MNLPRLTGALRAFSTVTLSTESNDEPGNRQLRSKRARSRRSDGRKWDDLSVTLEIHSKQRKSEVTSALRQLVHVSREIVGSDASPEAVESTAVFLFLTLKDCERVGHDETLKLRDKLGPFQAKAASEALKIIQGIVRYVPQEVLEKLEKNDELLSKEFGKNLHFSHNSYCLQNGPAEQLSSEESEDEEYEFSMSYSANTTVQPAVNNSHRHKDDASTLTGNWLLEEVRKYYSSDLDMSVENWCESIFDILSSAKSNDELQNDLFELLGFDRFELMQKLLDNRQKIISAAINGVPRSAVRQVKKSTGHSGPSRPNYGAQVTIQSEAEKQLQKQIRKDERRQHKRESKADDSEEMDFEPQLLRMERERALQEASRTPLFSHHAYIPQQEMYPHVYDSMLEAQLSSSFIGGTKMSLPIGFEKKSNKMYEEVTIPPSAPAPVHIGKQRIRISDLDELGQLAFKGMKALNRIQSVVFETAYHTNENLLICAPTGAGKTNIAMLAILRELQRHIQQGVIKKDEFKIIYVAPMKALAGEMVRNFGGRLAPLGVSVRELTGDMQLTKSEIQKTQMLVTTPEKWDVVTRKSTGDVALTQIVKLLIIDEVHLLHEDRGAVIESLVARTLRQVESSQSMIRIIGLSATLPNYLDVAQFLRVNPYQGLFFFDGRFRPVPLGQTFIGIKTINRMQQLKDMDQVCYDKVVDMVERGHQVMVFVHARNATVRTAMSLRELAKNNGDSGLFTVKQSATYGAAEKQVMRSPNKQLRDLFPDGFATHHAGMLRQDRNLVERLFAEGLIKVLVSTATLAWGVNLPAHAVIIKGTQLYDAHKGTFVDLGMLDVMQIFGRAGRPQYDTYGQGTIITTQEKLSHYLSLLTRQNPIESQFTQGLADNLNAEISLGTVTNVEEAVKWLQYTYLFVRMRKNPMVYGLSYKAAQEDPALEKHRTDLITVAARTLDKAYMIRFDELTGYLHATDLGRTASHFYIKTDTIMLFNEFFKPLMTEADVFSMISKSQEFEQIKVRDDELTELEYHMNESCVMAAAGGVENGYGKVNILLQAFISKTRVESFSLVSDSAYVAQNSGRIVRALFDVAIRKGWPTMAAKTLELSKVVDKRLWAFEHPLKQFSVLSYEICKKLENKNLSIDRMREMTKDEIGHMIHHVRMGEKVKQLVHQFPLISLDANIQPITRTVLRVRLTVSAEFNWNDRIHGNTTEPWWIWVEDPENNHIYHSEYFLMHKKQVINREPQELVFTIPIFEPLPSQYIVNAVSDRWLGASTMCAISFQHLILPEKHPPNTELLNLQPLPVSALGIPEYESLYKFTHFNPVQTQIFHTLYHTDYNVLLGAPTGSGKTVAAELAMFRVFNVYPKTKCVYIAPLKALVRERIDDWKMRIQSKLGKKVIEMTGDITPDIRAISTADIIVTTPEKWDGVSRSWQNRNYVQEVSLLIIDEIHLLGGDRGPVLEVIVSRTNFISSHTERNLRVIGLSTALANARDLADWLAIEQVGLFNFRPSVRPVPLEVHINGFPGKHYCPRMATMNKPTFQAIRTHSPSKPVLIFVSSRRQTRLTALDLIAFLAAEDDPKQWLHMEEREMENVIGGIRDNNLKLTLAFGIGIHHAGLHERDRKTVEELFVNQKIQVLIATSTLAWGVNFPAHLVVVKGTEYFDGKTCRYVDFPITDVLQMMGRAGRPQFDDQGKAVILVHDIKKHFYKKFLYEPFPVESNLLEVLPDHLNAEIVAGTITTKQDAMDYITWTYFFRRLVQNPSYYDLEDVEHGSINKFLSSLVEKALLDLESSYCLEIAEDNRSIEPLTLGRIASYYYLYHLSVRMFKDKLTADSSQADLLNILSDAKEYAELPVRHNEDALNGNLAEKCPLEVNPYTYDSSHTKTHLLLQAYFSRLQLPCTDYHTDTKSVLDQAIRILQAMLDVVADQGWLVTGLRIMHLVQMVVQSRWSHESTLLTLPHVEKEHLHCFRSFKGRPVECLPELIAACNGQRRVLERFLERPMSDDEIEDIWQVLCKLPRMDVKLHISGWWAEHKGQQDKPLSTAFQKGVRQDEDYTPVHADQEYVLHVDLERLNKPETKKDRRVHAPRFPKVKEEGWWLVLGDIEKQELLALKRVGRVYGRTSAPLAFYTPENTGRVIYTVYLMSDSYMGVDQQYDVCLDVIEANIEAQFNTEVSSELQDELDQQ
ncbi:activating signal cointegrator 1 complex subunit 3-like [Ptychodera flava]|uniref:activating signal cointegrator 1 complex subunit 3-like n=1 Tax=Ptychodera flava TaxID=63121 RepID=UPI00396A1652